jgi:hypothetical protein
MWSFPAFHGLVDFFSVFGEDTADIVTSPIFMLLALIVGISFAIYALFTGNWSNTMIGVAVVVGLFFAFKLLHYVVTGFHFELGGLVDKSRIQAIESAPVPEIIIKKQVFNLPDNSFTYDDAKSVCKAYGGRLATYKEIESAYTEGADWCRYGWSDGQMALFPTQQSSYDELQKRPGHEHDCGRPGVNGGHIDDPTMRFGANCFGYKPEMTMTDRERMELAAKRPKSKEELEEELKIKRWRKKIPTIMVAPFNYDNWSRI